MHTRNTNQLLKLYIYVHTLHRMHCRLSWFPWTSKITRGALFERKIFYSTYYFSACLMKWNRLLYGFSFCIACFRMHDSVFQINYLEHTNWVIMIWLVYRCFVQIPVKPHTRILMTRWMEGKMTFASKYT